MAAPRFKTADPGKKGVQLVLPLGGRIPKAVEHDPSEEEIQSLIVNRLQLLHFEVLVTSRHRQRPRCPHCSAIVGFCRSCGQEFKWPKMGDGCDPGIPDLLVRSRGSTRFARWPDYCWLGIEVKGPKTPFTKAKVRGVVVEKQRELAEDRSTALARSWENAWAAVVGYHGQLQEVGLVERRPIPELRTAPDSKKAA